MKILLVGPLPPPITGYAIANELVARGLTSRHHQVYALNSGNFVKMQDAHQQGRFDYRKFAYACRGMLRDSVRLATSQADVLYLTPGQTFLGFIRYFPYFLWARLRGIPLVLHFHGGFFRLMYNALDPWRRCLIRASLRLSSRLIVLGPSLRDMFEGIADTHKIVTCIGGINEELILSTEDLQAKIAAKSRQREMQVLYISALLKTKGILDLLDAIALLNAEGVKVHLDIAGTMDPGIKSEFYEKLALLKDSAIYHGMVDHQQKKQLMQKNYLFCLPTYYPIEGQPAAILEAYGAGSVVVCTNHSGIKDIFSPEINGIYCEAKNPRSIADSLIAAYKLPIETIRNNHESCRRNYTETALVTRLEALLADTLPGGTQR
jgi:glycosyltransferase involved in cell wall biosynthesis